MRLLKAVIIALLLLYTVLALYVPPALFSDPAAGFLQGEYFAQGIDWRKFITPNPSDISKDTEIYFTIWSPGQHMFPYILQKATGSIASATIIVLFLFSALGLIGYYRVFLDCGFRRELSLLAITIIAMQRYVSLPFGMYNGGETLIFGCTPWILLYALRIPPGSVGSLAALIPLFLFGLVCKLSFLISAVAISLYCIQSHFKIRKTLVTAAAFIITYAIAYLIFLRYGWNASETGGGTTPERIYDSLLFLPAGMLWSSFSIGSMFSRVFSYPGHQIYKTFMDARVFLHLSALLSCITFLYIFRSNQMTLKYKKLLGAFIAAHVVLYFYLFNFGSAVSFEERRLLPVGLLLLPGIITLIYSLQRPLLKKACYLFILLSCLYGVTSYFVRFERNASLANVGKSGFTQHNIDRVALGYLHTLDENLPQSSNSLFYLPSPEIALEVKHHRRVSVHVDFRPEEWLQEREYHGRVDNLIIALPTALLSTQKDEIILRNFVDYPFSKWHEVEKGNFTFFLQRNDDTTPQQAAG